jgi:hypothetical protein
MRNEELEDWIVQKVLNSYHFIIKGKKIHKKVGYVQKFALYLHKDLHNEQFTVIQM